MSGVVLERQCVPGRRQRSTAYAVAGAGSHLRSAVFAPLRLDYGRGVCPPPARLRAPPSRRLPLKGGVILERLMQASYHSPLEGESQKPSRQAKADAVGGTGRQAAVRGHLSSIQHRPEPAGHVATVQKRPSSLRKSMGRSVFPSRARSARTSPTRGANLNPWPENPAPKSTCSNWGWRSMMKWPSGVRV